MLPVPRSHHCEISPDFSREKLPWGKDKEKLKMAGEIMVRCSVSRKGQRRQEEGRGYRGFQRRERVNNGEVENEISSTSP